MKPFTPNEQRRADLEKLRDRVLTLSDGEIVSWLELEQSTGVKMDDRGRDLFRLACSRLKRPYKANPGNGVEMSSSTNALDIVADKTKRVTSALETARETTDQVAGRHLDQMDGEARKKIEHHRAVFATIGLSSSLSKKLG
jgi:hypothetical protein